MVNASIQGQTMADLVQSKQTDICHALSDIDGSDFDNHEWKRPGGGGGISRSVCSDLYEKGGVNTSMVHGTITEREASMFQQLMARVNPSSESVVGATFFATGISLVIHPTNPYIPSVHANYRYFEITTPNGHHHWWMGGGADLTPYYRHDEDIIHFHRVHHDACESYKPSIYFSFKQACDEYFYLPHRHECRGVGGIFFDYLSDDFNRLHDFVARASSDFIKAYTPIVIRQKDTPYSNRHRQWQGIRRARYAEFNLLYDRGTLFGLKTNGRIDSIFMSMPPVAHWIHHEPLAPDSDEQHLLTVLSTPQDWIPCPTLPL